MTVLVATAVSALRVRLDEPTAAQWQDADLRGWLNEGIRDIARQTRLYTGQTTVAVALGSAHEMVLPSTIIAIEHLLWKATGETRTVPLEARSFSAVQRYVNETGADPYFYTTYGHAPDLRVQLWPTPTRPGNLYLYGPQLPAALDVATGTGNIDVIEGWYEAALDYAEYMARRKDKDDAAWKDVFQLYDAKVKQMIELSATDDSMGEFTFTGTSIVPTWLSEFD
jgi:hypothetical protein